ncbi:hypothetical protein [Sphingobacterium prati]|nr:hypothetical protein [Sphingobacterium prati]
MPKSESILLNRMDSNSSIAIGIWDGSTPRNVFKKKFGKPPTLST